MRKALSGGSALLALLLCAGCGPEPKPPAAMRFEGLPVAGNAGDAVRAGFTECIDLGAIRMRCRRHDVMVAGQGPYEAAVDLMGTSGRSGFDHLILWNDGEQEAVYKLVEELQRRGWQHCETGDDHAGDQDIYTRPGVPVRVSMDLSYYGKRRVRIIPLWDHREPGCKPY